jgi:hypothetical protein
MKGQIVSFHERANARPVKTFKTTCFVILTFIFLVCLKGGYREYSIRFKKVLRLFTHLFSMLKRRMTRFKNVRTTTLPVVLFLILILWRGRLLGVKGNCKTTLPVALLLILIPEREVVESEM